MRASKERPTLWVMLPHLLLAAVSVHADVPGVADLPITPPAAPLSTRDWLVEPPARGARITRSEDGAQLVLDNGLIRRTIRVAPDGATVGLDDLTTGASLLRAVRPEAVVVLDGERHEVGGLTGQPNHAFLLPGWVEPSDMREMKRIAEAMGANIVLFPDTSDVVDTPQAAIDVVLAHRGQQDESPGEERRVPPRRPPV